MYFRETEARQDGWQKFAGHWLTHCLTDITKAWDAIASKKLSDNAYNNMFVHPDLSSRYKFWCENSTNIEANMRLYSNSQQREI